MSKFKKFNDNLAATITKAVGSMGCAYIFAIIAFIGLPSAVQQSVGTQNPLPIVSWVGQTFLQLFLLSIIMVGQSVQSAKSDARTEKTLNHISNDNNRILEELKVLLKKA